MSEEAQLITKFASGARRSSDAAKFRYDLINHVGLRRLAETYCEGAEKYDKSRGIDEPYNWTKGMPISDVLNHVVRHVYLWLGGDVSEDHLAHAAWGLFAAMYFEETRPDLNDCYFARKARCPDGTTSPDSRSGS